MKTFLKPLTMAEEQYYLQQYQRGDMEAKNILIERNLRLVAHVVKKYQGTDVELDDLISIGTIGLMKAISTFDSTKQPGCPHMQESVSTMNCLCYSDPARSIPGKSRCMNPLVQTKKAMRSVFWM